MNTIKMGNDEFILYCRKNGHGINKTTDQLGRLIWEWIRDKANGRQIENNKECLWGRMQTMYHLPVFHTQPHNLNLTAISCQTCMIIWIRYNISEKLKVKNERSMCLVKDSRKHDVAT